MDSGKFFELAGGTLYVTAQGGAIGNLTIAGDAIFSGGTIWDNVSEATGDQGLLRILGNAALSTQCLFRTRDVARVGGVPSYWNTVIIAGIRAGDFSFAVPAPNWTATWINGVLIIGEPG